MSDYPKYRKAKYIEQNPDSKTYTASIDAMRQYGYTKQWHLSAIEFHHKEEAEALRLRDLVFDFLERADANLAKT